MSNLPNEILSNIARYLPPSDAIYSVVKVYRSQDDAAAEVRLPDDLLSRIAGYLEPSHPLHSFIKSKGGAEKEEEKCHKGSDDQVEKRFEDECDEAEEGKGIGHAEGFSEEDFNIALELLRAPSPNSLDCFHNAPDIDISPIPVNPVVANAPVMSEGELCKNVPSLQKAAVLERQVEVAASEGNAFCAEQRKNVPSPKRARLPRKSRKCVPQKAKKPPLSKRKKSTHHLDKPIAGYGITLREAFERGQLDPKKTIISAKGNQNRTHELNQDRLQFVRARLQDYAALREREASNNEMADFNRRAFDDFVTEDEGRIFLGLDEHQQWKRLAPKEAKGKLAQCFRDEWMKWSKRQQSRPSQPGPKQDKGRGKGN